MFHYLCAVLNSETLGDLVRPHQSVGAFGPRHFDKYVWYPPTPQFDAENEGHRHRVDLAIEAEQVATGVAVPEGIAFQQAHKLLRTEFDRRGRPRRSMLRWQSCSVWELADDKGQRSMTDDAGSVPHVPEVADVENLIRLVGSEVGLDPELAIDARPSEEASPPTLANLDRVESRLWTHFSGSAPTLGGDFPHAQLVACAWVSAAYRQAHAAFILCKQGFPDAVCANARVAVDHGVYLSLLAAVDSVDSVLDPLEGAYFRNAETIFGGMDEEVPEFLSFILTDLAGSTTLSSDTKVTVFQQVCERLKTRLLAERAGTEQHPVWRSLSERLEELRRAKIDSALVSVELLKRLLEVAKDLVTAERSDEAGRLDEVTIVDPDRGCTHPDLGGEYASPGTPVIIENVVEQMDAIERPGRDTGWQTSQPGDRDIRRRLRLSLKNNGLPPQGALFHRAYTYIAEHY